MAHTDVIVLGAGIVGTSIAVHLARRGVSVALVDRSGPGEGTSYGNAGIIEGNSIFPPAFPADWGSLLRIALKRSPVVNYHAAYLLRIMPWLAAFRAASRPSRLTETARLMRPLFARAVAEHDALAAEAGAGRYLSRRGWLKLYRTDSAFAALAPELDLATRLGIANVPLDRDGARVLEPALAGVFRRAVHWTGAVSVSNPLALTRAYAARFAALGGLALTGDACTLHRANPYWRVETAAGPLDAGDAVIALGPWAPDVLSPLGIKLPLAVKRGYHRHFRPQGNAALNRPVLDAENGYVLAPMEQGIRVTTGVEFAARDAAPTPVQFDRLLPAARELFALGEPVEAQPWLGARPCFPDSRPVIARAPRQRGLWLAFGHAHWGLTLGPATGRLVAEMMTGATPFCDPKPFSADRFTR
ncbi:MAG TPA: FAD-dependent oxidoreductase [Xanthobacteraceae bacterium]|nr:FAD-dependent oxidoreductase [Xanthobacteraceae bacterium]